MKKDLAQLSAQSCSGALLSYVRHFASIL
jgi:hypothetical protein